MVKKFRFLLFDANIIIELFKQEIWNEVIHRCDIWFGETVAFDETLYYETVRGDRVWLRKEDIVVRGKVTLFSLRQSLVKSTLKPIIDGSSISIDDIDPGEAELLTMMLLARKNFLICSSDKIIFRFLGLKLLGEKGISLEEILDLIGLGRSLKHEYMKHYREKWTDKGFQERPS